jgi:hypothetical protein
MKKVEHALKFVTEFDETHPASQQFFMLSEDMQVHMLESMLKELLAKAVQPTIDEINENGSWAILKLAE